MNREFRGKIQIPIQIQIQTLKVDMNDQSYVAGDHCLFVQSLRK